MKVITKAYLISAVAERWFDLYYIDGGMWERSYWGTDRAVTYEQLKALTNPTEQDIASIIGNESWTRLQCNHCRRDVEAVVIVDVTHGEYTTYLCAECLRAALEMLKKETT